MATYFLPTDEYAHLEILSSGVPLVEVFPNGILFSVEPNGEVHVHDPSIRAVGKGEISDIQITDCYVAEPKK